MKKRDEQTKETDSLAHQHPTALSYPSRLLFTDPGGGLIIFHSICKSKPQLNRKDANPGGTPSSYDHLLTTKPHGISMWFAPSRRPPLLVVVVGGGGFSPGRPHLHAPPASGTYFIGWAAPQNGGGGVLRRVQRPAWHPPQASKLFVLLVLVLVLVASA